MMPAVPTFSKLPSNLGKCTEKELLESLLNERGNRYGEFDTQTTTAQGIKTFLRDTPNWKNLEAAKREALELIATKISRIMHGDPNYKDSWEDIAGYAKLIADKL